MQNKNPTVHLLILDPSQNDAEALVSLLRNSGRATRAHRITSEEALEEAIDTRSWDLMLARDVAQELSPEDALAIIRRLDKDIPFILLSDNDSRERAVQFMRAGAQDLVHADHTDLLVLTVKRELAALEARRKQRTLEAQLREADQRCQLLLESSKDAIAYIDDGMHIYANQSYLDFLGYDDIVDLMSVPVLDTLCPESQTAYRNFIRAFIDKPEDGARFACVAKRSDNQQINVIMSASAATYDGEPCIQVIIQPEQNDAELEEKLRQISSQDLLTGLYNRQHMMDELGAAILQSGETHETGALAYIALDNFIPLKSKIGIAGSDLLIGDLATLFKDLTGDDVLLARLGDDAFGLLAQRMSESAMAEHCQMLCQKVEDHLFQINERTIQVTVSIGVAAITENAPKASELMARAHLASAEVRKLEGHEHGNGVVTYNPADFETAADGHTAEAIQRALDDDRFRLYFQPVINLRGEDDELYEVSVRMLNANNVELTPDDFLPPTRASDIAIKIDRWVLLQAIRQLAALRAKGKETRLFVTLTAETLQDRTFSQWLSVALKAARLPGEALVLQVHEGDASTYLKQTKELGASLQELHCKLAISQFGGALNPFNILRHVDVDYVKFDGSFTEEIQGNEETRDHLKEMIQSLQNTGKLTIIPQVENASVLATLWQVGANYVQGYYLQAPGPEMNYDFSAQ
ncbi:EAL domain-containing protein [Marinobacter sp. X15-166B]|uniref:EAL domain-containing response regulator n=1 Tax=Marinobacter sp. X15-166B TaxID=1897620 RepID=UPI00085BD19A|nr:EAL domain-containing protein [Marinobacter sp. X15-166B]OEY65257.1 diguanylate cyclase [Marinobacter sp. X15-166B]